MYIATKRIVQLYFNITRTVFKMSDYRVTSCISVGYLIVYVVNIVKTITGNETKVFFYRNYFQHFPI